VTRRLTDQQQAYASEAMDVVQPAIRAFLKRNPGLRHIASRVDVESVAMQAVCVAALTYTPTKSKVTTYFSTAIRHAVAREIYKQQKRDQRFALQGEPAEPKPDLRQEKYKQFAIKALKMLPEPQRTLLEDRLIEEVTLGQLGSEHGLDPRTIAKRVAEAVEQLRRAASDLP
jgi:RNA polymerase sigma factor (sigma-70 family)